MGYQLPDCVCVLTRDGGLRTSFKTRAEKTLAPSPVMLEECNARQLSVNVPNELFPQEINY